MVAKTCPGRIPICHGVPLGGGNATEPTAISNADSFPLVLNRTVTYTHLQYHLYPCILHIISLYFDVLQQLCRRNFQRLLLVTIDRIQSALSINSAPGRGHVRKEL